MVRTPCFPMTRAGISSLFRVLANPYKNPHKRNPISKISFQYVINIIIIEISNDF